MSTELAKTVDQQALSQQLAEITGTQQHVTTSLDLKTGDGRRQMIKCLQDCDARLTDQVNTVISIKDFLAHNVSIRMEADGEYIEAVRLVVIDANGTRYECVSTGLLKSLGHLLFLYGDPPWEAPVKVTVRTKRNKERNIYWFEPVE
jgi:hypothetical protein